MDETTSYLRDDPARFALFFAALGILGVLVFRSGVLHRLPVRLVFKATAIVVTVTSVLLVWSMDKFPGTDQLNCLLSAREFVSGEFGSLSLDRYLGFYPQNIGLTLYFSVFSALFGEADYLALQYMNILWLLAAFYCLVRVTQLMFRKQFVTNLTILLFAGFFPLLFFVTFLYGTLIGLALALAAVLLLLRFLEDWRFCHIVCSALLLGCSVLFRKNNLIVWIAMSIMLAIVLLSRETKKPAKRRAVLALAALCLCVWLMPALPRTVLLHTVANDLPVNEGMPAAAWVAMGMQDGPGAPGWSNGYNGDVYMTYAGFDPQTAKNLSYSEIKSRAVWFLRHPGEAVSFYHKKITSMWNNPSYTCFWILRAYNTAGAESTPAGQSFLAGDVHDGLSSYMNLYQGLVLLGSAGFFLAAFARALLGAKPRFKRSALLLMLIFAGGFLFHLLWEAKAQYAVVYFVLLLPYAAFAAESAASRILQLLPGGSAAEAKAGRPARRAIAYAQGTGGMGDQGTGV